MMNLLILMLILLILFVMMLLNFILSKKMFKNREKSSPFECGFDSMVSNRLPFSLQFYLISMIFLIFDVEIALILPMVLMFSYMKVMILITSMIILLILLVGLFMEWKEGALKWFK
uniref:NADH dehydrogenase subunit 3 n=1 Tax=Eurytoma acutibialis TaxID=3102739 RepID=UPI002E78FBFC|nr:NADH dehydrogenase subunit 3 [Eurytoma acutibialis]WPS67070.1 NADH dehydrogenase subunit 3 [Eurytoma acutibialis]